MAHQILLKRATLLTHEDKDNVVAVKADLLIVDDIIAEIGDSIQASATTEVIDCSNFLVSPGFVNTHHHVWQTQLKGVHANHTLLEYFGTGSFPGNLFTLNDMYWGQLSGALENIDAGTTTVVDHAHLNYSPNHSEVAVKATAASGIRSIFCYCPTSRVTQWQPKMIIEHDLFPEWVMETMSKLGQTTPTLSGGRVELGFALDATHMPPEFLRNIFNQARTNGARLITCHAVHGAMFHAPGPSMVRKLADGNLLTSDFLLSHANNLPPEDIESIRSAGAYISCTPLTELPMGHGNPVGLDQRLYNNASLGVDCHSICTASMPTQMMTLLQWQRSNDHAELEARGRWSRTNKRKVQDVYNLGTIMGARAIGKQNEIGSIQVGKKADLVLFDCTTPSMLAVAERDPVAAIVLHSTIRDVDTVIVDGVVRKRGGVLLDVDTSEVSLVEDGGTPVASLTRWSDIVAAVRRSRDEFDARFRKEVDTAVAEEGITNAYYLNRNDMLDLAEGDE